MRILEVESINFMSSAPTRVRFPRAGIVVVSGPNGAGKSSLVETIAVALFGRTLRGTPWWPHGAKSSTARVETDVVLARRERSGTKTKLDWSLNEGEDVGLMLANTSRLASTPGEVALAAPTPLEAPTFETTKQAQEAVEAVVGRFDAWRRCSAFSSSDAAHFSGATDGERKRLLESILGLDRFDVAQAACARDLKEADARIGEARVKLQAARSKHENAAERLAQSEVELARAREDVPKVVDLPPAIQDFDGLTASVRSAKADMVAGTAAVEASARAVARADLLLEQARAASARFASGFCPTCRQPVQQGDHHASTVAEAEGAVTRARSHHRAVRADADEIRWVVDGLTSKWHEALEARRLADMQATVRKRADARVAQVEREVAASKSMVDGALAEIHTAEEVFGAAARDVQVLRSVDVALGLRGIRAHVLARSLDGLSAVANSWLPRLGLPDMRVALKPYTERASGGVADAISLEVEGAGDGYGYNAASGGERRRVDVAVILALAEIGQAAQGRTGSTLFFDEVFDRLDQDGAAALSVALEDLARDRCVVLITHHPDIVAGVRAALRLHVEGGVTRVVGGAA